jgi:uncharacterized membrane protein
MDNTSQRVLLVGEAWTTHTLHVKGFSAFSASSYGEGADWLRDALESAGHDVTFMPTPLATRDFPSTAGELAAYDVVILSDIPSDTILLHPDTFERGLRTPDRLAAVAEFVERGGGLLMIGGYMSFSGIDGKARYAATALRDVLPVEMLVGDDRVELPAGIAPTVGDPHEVLDRLSADWPYFLGYNRFRARADACVALTAGSDPFLVLGHHAGGRAAAFASDCAPHWGSPAFLEWPDYGPFWSALVAWLGSSKD